MARTAKRITLTIYALHGGGAERIAAQMANHWSGHDQVTVITLGAKDEDVYELSDRIERVGLNLLQNSKNLLQKLGGNWQRLMMLRRAIKRSQPDVVVSLVDQMNVLVLLSTVGLTRNVVVCEHTDPRRHEIGRIWARLRKLIYPRCLALTILTEDLVAWGRRVTKRRPVYVVPNFVASPSVSMESSSAKVGPLQRTIVSMGRLAYPKGFERLITAFAKCAEVNQEWRLKIIGEGPERAQLVEQCASMGLAERVEFTGWLDQPLEQLALADLFVMPSRYEGFPMALLEAMSCGLPVVSFDCQSGPAEIIRDGIDGLLVPADDVDRLAQAMSKCMQDSALRQSLGRQARKIVNRFGKETFFARWDAILSGCSTREYEDWFGTHETDSPAGDESDR